MRQKERSIWRPMVAIFFLGLLVWYLEGCAGQGLQERWEGCATPSHEICQDAEGMEFKTCMYDYYLECIQDPYDWYGGNRWHDGII